MLTDMVTLQGMKMLARTLARAVLVLCPLFVTPTTLANDFTVAVLSSGKSPIYTRIIETIEEVVHGQRDNVTFDIAFIGDAEPGEIINKADLLLTIGRRAMLAAGQHGATPPIIASLVPRQAYEQNLPALKSANQHVAAIYIDSPPQRQILLASLLLGPQQTIGTLLSASSISNKTHIARLFQKAGLKYRIESIGTEDNLIRKLSRLLSRSDALLALPDPLIFNRNTARNILLTTYRRRIPVIGFSANYVKAGALAAAFSTPEQVARQTGDTIVQFLKSPEEFRFKGRYPTAFNVAVNPNVARSLNIVSPPPATLKRRLESALERFK